MLNFLFWSFEFVLFIARRPRAIYTRALVDYSRNTSGTTLCNPFVIIFTTAPAVCTFTHQLRLCNSEVLVTCCQMIKAGHGTLLAVTGAGVPSRGL